MATKIINGRTYIHQDECGRPARFVGRIDSAYPHVFAVLGNHGEGIETRKHDDPHITPIPEKKTRPVHCRM